MLLAKNQAESFNLGHIGWKYYNTIKKKAVEQEFSWSGLLISLSIAFFIVIISALLLNFIFNSVEAGRRNQTFRLDLSAKQNVKYININCG